VILERKTVRRKPGGEVPKKAWQGERVRAAGRPPYWRGVQDPCAGKYYIWGKSLTKGKEKESVLWFGNEGGSGNAGNVFLGRFGLGRDWPAEKNR